MLWHFCIAILAVLSFVMGSSRALGAVGRARLQIATSSLSESCRYVRTADFALVTVIQLLTITILAGQFGGECVALLAISATLIIAFPLATLLAERRSRAVIGRKGNYTVSCLVAHSCPGLIPKSNVAENVLRPPISS